MEIVSIGNIIEGCFWFLVSLVFFVPALRPKEGHRWFCLSGGALFVIFGLSDMYESTTGAWWKPWWLILWNVGCVGGMVLLFFWYKRIMGSWRDIMEKWNRPLFRKRDDTQNEN
jgi:hypothetical protein